MTTTNKKVLPLTLYLKTSMTIFAMLFGAGNLILPLKLGLQAGSNAIWSFIGFAITAVLLPLVGLLGIVAFSGSYEKFFGRLGKVPGNIAILACMLIIGPAIAMPRIIMLSYEMLYPFIPTMSEGLFALLFVTLVFFATFRPGRLLDIIGNVLAPFKVISIASIIIAGLITGKEYVMSDAEISSVFVAGVQKGYVTLDLLGAIFFGSIVVTLLTGFSDADEGEGIKTKQAMKVAAISGLVAAAFLALVYLGMTYLGALHGAGLEMLNEGKIFSTITLRILGVYGAALVGFTVFLACFTTTVSLSAVVSEYIHTHVFQKRVSFAATLGLLLLSCVGVARFGLGAILETSEPFILILYPVLIVITLCNVLYSLYGFKAIKIPSAVALAAFLGHAVYNAFTTL